MSERLLKDKNIQPTDEFLAMLMGDKLFKEYKDFLANANKIDVDVSEWKYCAWDKAWYQKGSYSWETPRGAKKQTTTFWLSLWEGFFKIGIFPKPQCRDEVLSLPLSEQTKSQIPQIKQVGKMTVFPINIDVSDKVPKDVFTLIEYKKRCK